MTDTSTEVFDLVEMLDESRERSGVRMIHTILLALAAFLGAALFFAILLTLYLLGATLLS